MAFVNVLIKPSSSMCNMRCRYCFYENVSNCRSEKSFGFITAETTEALIASAYKCAGRGGEIVFSFQGGEPTLIGLEYYRQFLTMERKYSDSGSRVTHSIQTNGYLIDEQWAAFFRDNEFLVGLSVDGSEQMHDRYRVMPSGDGTYCRVTEALRILQQYAVEVNLLCVVTRQSGRNPQRLYRCLKELGVPYLQFIPCLEPLEQARNTTPYALTPELYGKFLCGLFDVWYQDWKNGHYTSVRLFDDYIHIMLGMPPGSCAACGRCGSYVVAEGNGNLYPCDFYVLDEWLLGNIGECSIGDALSSETAVRFLRSDERHLEHCTGCRWYKICGGGCKRDWDVVTQKNYYCGAFQRFFEYAYDRLAEIARMEYRALHGMR